MIKIINIVALSAVLASCGGGANNPAVAGRPVVPLVNQGEIINIINNNGTVKVTAKSELIRTIDFGNGEVDIKVRKYGWGRTSHKDMVNYFGYGYVAGGFGFLGSGGIRRIVYSEEVMIFDSGLDRDLYMSYQYHQKYYDMKHVGGLFLGFSIDNSREQISIQISKLEVREYGQDKITRD